MKKLILFFVLILIIGDVSASFLVGEVRDSLSNSPVSGCNVVADCEGNTLNRYTSVTGSNGGFSMGNSECSYYNLIIFCGGEQYSFGNYNQGYGVFFVNQNINDPFAYQGLDPYDESIPATNYNYNVDIGEYAPEPSYTEPSSDKSYYWGAGYEPPASNTESKSSSQGNVADSSSNEQVSTDISGVYRGGSSSPSSKSWSSGKQEMSADEVLRDLNSALEKGYHTSSALINSDIIYKEQIENECEKGCCESDKGIAKDNPHILADCYDKDGAHWDKWGTEYSCSSSSKITGNSVLNFLVGWAVKEKEKCVEKKTDIVLDEKFILNEGLVLNSVLWGEIKEGKYSGGGRSKKSWSKYLSQIEAYRNNIFNRLDPLISTELTKYPFQIEGLGGGGNWHIRIPTNKDITKWDDISDVDKINFYGVSLAYNDYSLPQETTMVHEYFHGIWDIYGVFADKENRKIDRAQFRSDTEKLAHDSEYLKDPEIKFLIEEGWGVKEGNEEELLRVRKEYLDDVGADATIPQVLTERFASLSQIYYDNPNSLPPYIKKHFEIFFKE